MLLPHRVVVPEKGQKRALKILHEGLLELAEILWWPGIYEQIENTVKEYNECHMSRNVQPPVGISGVSPTV